MVCGLIDLHSGLDVFDPFLADGDVVHEDVRDRFFGKDALDVDDVSDAQGAQFLRVVVSSRPGGARVDLVLDLGCSVAVVVGALRLDLEVIEGTVSSRERADFGDDAAQNYFVLEIHILIRFFLS